ncbi:MAG: FHA domain-containing protein [Limisphaerales bacterium]
MARVQIVTEGFHNQVFELRLGVNRIGRSPANDFTIEHPTVSGRHCEIVLSETEIVVRDCDSTNGTFVAGQPVSKAVLSAGQTLRLGDVEMLVDSTEVKVSIPTFETAKPAPPVVLWDGSMLCRRHPQARATHQCTNCHEVLCDECVHHMRRRGGKVLKLCPLCSHKCERIGGEKKKKKTFLGFLQKTVKLPFMRSSSDEEE